MTLFTLMDGQSNRPGFGSGLLTPPGSPTSTTGGWLLGTMFTVTEGMQWFNGYEFFVPPSGDTAPVGGFTFGLWDVYATTTQLFVAGSKATAATLTADLMNTVSLATPLQIAPGETYVSAVGYTAAAGIPLSSGQFGSGNNYSGGITNGPLTAWPGGGGTSPFPFATTFNYGQGLFSNSLGNDPTAAMPNNGSGNDFFWIGPVISNAPPAGYTGSYRLRPNSKAFGATSNTGPDTVGPFTLGLEFSSSVPVALNYIWFYSASGVTVLPTGIGVFRVSDQSTVASNLSPSWSGVAGSGWVRASFSSPPNLQAGVNYKLGVLGGNGAIFNYYLNNYWSSGNGFGGAGLTSGPISYPNTTSATSPGQASYNAGSSLAYPGTNAGPFDYLIDGEFTPIAGGPVMLMASYL